MLRPLVQKKVDFNFPARPCIPSTASSEALFPWQPAILTHLSIWVSGQGTWQKMGPALNKVDKITLDSMKLILNFNMTTRQYIGVYRLRVNQGVQRSYRLQTVDIVTRRTDSFMEKKEGCKD